MITDTAERESSDEHSAFEHDSPQRVNDVEIRHFVQIEVSIGEARHQHVRLLMIVSAEKESSAIGAFEGFFVVESATRRTACLSASPFDLQRTYSFV